VRQRGQASTESRPECLVGHLVGEARIVDEVRASLDERAAQRLPGLVHLRGAPSGWAVSVEVVGVVASPFQAQEVRRHLLLRQDRRRRAADAVPDGEPEVREASLTAPLPSFSNGE
jgi:hypothetical protein